MFAGWWAKIIALSQLSLLNGVGTSKMVDGRSSQKAMIADSLELLPSQMASPVDRTVL
jgi:hypothetical protein